MSDPAFERRAIQLYEAMLDVPESERDAWLARETDGDPALAARLEAMREAGRLAALSTGAALDHAEEEPAPARIGAYRITDLIGRGGMGAVYRGERDTGDFSHVVAIKVIRSGLLSPALIERFGRERAILARLRHPGIAQLHDGGETESGSPFIVMEFVEGRPLLRWAEEEAPSRAERLAVFALICDAVAFAHRNLVVHRDLTPSNVLVTGDAGRWGVKLIDFGIARPADVVADALSARGTPPERASIVSLSLTPGYAAPERMVAGPVTTAADVFSLGRLLDALVPGADRELRAIVTRATAADPQARYPTVEALAEDVARMADGRAVAAMGGGAGYHLSRFLRRHRLPVFAGAAALLALVAALALTLTAYRRAETAREAEAARFAELRSLAGFMLFDLNGRLSRVVGTIDARERLAARAQRYLGALAGSSATTPALELEAARGFIALATIQGVPSEPNLGQYEPARANLARAMRLLEGSPLPRAQVAPDVALALARVAMLEAHGAHDTKRANAALARAERVLSDVAAQERGTRWLRARSEVRRSQLDMAVLNQDVPGIGRLADRLERDIGDWPEKTRQGFAAEFDRAVADHYRGIAGYFTDALTESIRRTRAADARFAVLERARPGDPLLLYFRAFNAYIGYGSAEGTDDVQALRFLAAARAASDRLAQLEPRDRTVLLLAVKIRAAEAQSLSERGRHNEAVALQKDVVAFHTAQAKRQSSDSAGNQLTTAQLILANIAIRARDRALACEATRAANQALADLDRKGGAMGFVATYRTRLAANQARCVRSEPVAAMETIA
jgi:eukaryotic-like serine/threonine-protein kinase